MRNNQIKIFDILLYVCLGTVIAIALICLGDVFNIMEALS